MNPQFAAALPDSWWTPHGLLLLVKKDYYLGLWTVAYEIGGLYAGPFKTRREARARLAQIVEERTDEPA